MATAEKSALHMEEIRTYIERLELHCLETKMSFLSSISSDVFTIRNLSVCLVSPYRIKVSKPVDVLMPAIISLCCILLILLTSVDV
jgi:hypothetical protein